MVIIGPPPGAKIFFWVHEMGVTIGGPVIKKNKKNKNGGYSVWERKVAFHGNYSVGGGAQVAFHGNYWPAARPPIAPLSPPFATFRAIATIATIDGDGANCPL